MKLSQAKSLISNNEQYGFRVCFEELCDGILRKDCFPDQDELHLQTQSEAEELAHAFSKVKNVYNIFVVDTNYRPTNLFGGMINPLEKI